MRIFAGQHLSAQRDGDGAIVIRWDTPGMAFNQPHEDLLAEWSLVLDRLAELPRLPLVMLASGKKGFFGRGWSPDALHQLGTTGKLATMTEAWDGILERLESLPCPTLVASAGPCLDEAFDLAMACDYRLAYQDSGSVFGWTSQTRGWCPPPSTLKRVVSHAGIEFCCRLLILEEQLDAARALRWGLVSATASGEADLRGAVESLRKKAFLEGKPPRREPPRLMARIMNRSPFWRGWMLRGMKRVLDRLVCPELPVGAHQWRSLERAVTDPGWTDSDALGALRLLAEDAGAAWIRQTRATVRHTTQAIREPAVTRVVLLGNAPWEVEVARRALLNKVPVVVGAANAEELGRRVMRLGADKQVPSAAVLTMVQGRLITDLARNASLPRDAVIGATGALGETWAQHASLHVVDATNPSSGSIIGRSLHGAHRNGWIELQGEPGSAECWLNSWGFRVMSVEPGSGSIWKTAAAWWTESLRALAEGLSPGMIEHEASLFGFLKGPLADLCDNVSNLVWVVDEASEHDKDVLIKWKEIAGPILQKPREAGSLPIGWRLTRRWRRQCGLQVSPLVRSLPVSARLAGLRSRWIATVVSAEMSNRNWLRDPGAYLAALESRVGWPVFRGPPHVALAAAGETMPVLGARLVRLFGERYAGLAEFREPDTT